LAKRSLPSGFGLKKEIHLVNNRHKVMNLTINQKFHSQRLIDDSLLSQNENEIGTFLSDTIETQLRRELHLNLSNTHKRARIRRESLAKREAKLILAYSRNWEKVSNSLWNNKKEPNVPDLH